MKNFKFIKPYPLFKVEYEEIVGRDNSKSSVYRIYAKISEPMNWFLLYTTHTLGWAQVSLNRLKELFDIWIIKFITEDDLPTMFEVNGEIYKTQYVFPDQSCICGEQIAGNHRYAEFAIDYLKFDYVRELIFFYSKGTCLVKCNQLFLDGELLLNSKQLDSVCKEIGQDKSLLDSSPDKLLTYIINKYENVKTYICEGYTSYNLQ